MRGAVKQLEDTKWWDALSRRCCFDVVVEEARLVRFSRPVRKLMRRSVSRLLSVNERRRAIVMSSEHNQVCRLFATSF